MKLVTLVRKNERAVEFGKCWEGDVTIRKIGRGDGPIHTDAAPQNSTVVVGTVDGRYVVNNRGIGFGVEAVGKPFGDVDHVADA